MPLLRKDIKIGFIAGGGLLALGLGYVLMLSFSGGPDQANAGGQDQPGTPDPLGAPIDAANTDYSEWNDTASSAGNDWDEPFVTTTPNPGDPVPVVPFGDDAGEPATADLNGPSDASFGSSRVSRTTMRWMDRNHKVDEALVQVFNGGSGSKWYLNTTSYIRLDNIYTCHTASECDGL